MQIVICKDGATTSTVGKASTHSPTTASTSVRALMAVGVINDLLTSTIHCTLVFPPVNLGIEIFIDLPISCVATKW